MSRHNTIAMRLLRLLPWILPVGVNAQLLTNNGAVISSTFGSIVAVQGSILNQGPAGELDNSGTLILTGDFTHNAPNTCFGTAQGEVWLTGAAQSIGGTSVAIFNHLELAGTGTKTLMQDVEVGGNYSNPAGGLQLYDRTLDLNTHTLTMRNAAPSAIMRTTGYIVSETDPLAGYSFVRWNIGTSTGNYTIPFGNAATNAYLPFTGNITAAGTGATGYLRMATYPTITLASPNNRPLPTAVPSLVDVSGMENAPNVLDRWWVMEAGNYATAPVANTTFTYSDSEWSTGTNTIVEGALQLERQQGVWTMFPTVTNIGANTLTTSGIPLTTSSWTAAMMGTPLPVELLSFTAERTNEREVMMHWTTATEHNNAGFEVWRMIEGEQDFTEVGWADGAGDSQTLVNYELPDENTASQTSYYKLKQVDHDGRFVWSPAVAVHGTAIAAEIIAYPNPATDHLMLGGLPEGTSSITLHDAAGRVVQQWGATTVLNGLGAFHRGVYFVQAGISDGSVQTLRVVLE